MKKMEVSRRLIPIIVPLRRKKFWMADLASGSHPRTRITGGFRTRGLALCHVDYPMSTGR